MSHAGRRTAQGAASQRRFLLKTGGAGVAVLLVVVLVVLVARPQPVATLAADDDPRLGAADAPVTMFLFADYQCPFCARFETQGGLASLERDYVQTGKVQLVLKDDPFIGEDSWRAAIASQFVWRTDPQDFWAWSQGIYARQGAENSGWASADALAQHSAQWPAIDTAALRAALAANDRSEARQDAREAQAHGVVSTPTLVIEGRAYNANDLASVRAALDAALAAKGA